MKQFLPAQPLAKQTWLLFRKEITLEWRQKNSFYSLLLYMFGAVFVCYLSFSQRKVTLHPVIWNTLWWIIVLFAAFQSIVKSFIQEREERNYFYYQLVSPVAIILSKMLYNFLMMLQVELIGIVAYGVVMDFPVANPMMFALVMLFSSISFSTTLTMIAAIASKSNQPTALMAILGFPVILPMLLMLIRAAKNAIDGLEWSSNFDEWLVLTALNVIVVAISLMLFPYLWRN